MPDEGATLLEVWWVLLLRDFFSVGAAVEVAVDFFLTAWSVVETLFSSMGFNFGFLTTLSVVSVSGAVDLDFDDELRCFTSLTVVGASVVVVFFTLGVEAVGWFGSWG